MPVALDGRFVLVKTEVDPQRNPLKMSRKLQVGRRCEYGIAADDKQHFHPTSRHVLDEFAEPGNLVRRMSLDRLGIENGLAAVAQQVVHRMGESVDTGRLPLPRDDDAGAAMLLEIPGQGRDPATVTFGQCWPLRQPGDTQGGGDSACKAFHLRRTQGQPMVGGGAGERGHAFDDIQAIHGRPLGRPRHRGAGP